MTDAPAPWKSTRHAARIESLRLRGMVDEADSWIKQANQEAAEAAATGCRSATGGPGGPLGADSSGTG